MTATLTRSSAFVIAGPPPLPIHRLSVAQYHCMIDQGILRSDDRIELLDGWLVEKMPKHPPHATALALLVEALRRLLPDNYHLRVQEPMTTGTSEPEPDVAVVVGKIRDYSARHPSADDIPLLVEVSDSTIDRDQGLKLRIYATAGIQQYWILNLVDERIEIRREPALIAGQLSYNQREDYPSGQSAPVSLFGQFIGNIAVGEILP